MKLRIGIILAILAAMIPAANAVIVNIAVGDQPYYVHGPGYWGSRVLRVGSGTLVLASSPQSLGARPLRTALKRAQFVDFGYRSKNNRPAEVRARRGESSTGLALDGCANRWLDDR